MDESGWKLMKVNASAIVQVGAMGFKGLQTKHSDICGATSIFNGFFCDHHRLVLYSFSSLLCGICVFFWECCISSLPWMTSDHSKVMILDWIYSKEIRLLRLSDFQNVSDVQSVFTFTLFIYKYIVWRKQSFKKEEFYQQQKITEKNHVKR